MSEGGQQSSEAARGMACLEVMRIIVSKLI